MQGEKVSLSDLSGVQQTLLITAHGKVKESGMPDSRRTIPALRKIGRLMRNR